MSGLGKIKILTGPWDQQKKDIEYSKAIGIYIVANELNAILQNVFGMSGASFSFVKTVIMMVVLLAFLRRVLHFNIKEYTILIRPLIVFLFLYLYSYLLGSNPSQLVDWGITTLGICVPIGVFAYLISEKEILMSILYKCSWITFILLLIEVYGVGSRNYDMHFSYMMLFVILFHISHMLLKKKYTLLPFIAVELILNFVYGSRGFIVCVALFVALKILANTKNILKKILLIVIVGSVTYGVIYLLNNYGILFLNKIQTIGFNARTLRLFVEGDMISHDSGRNYLWEKSIELIQVRPILGWGIRGATEYLPNSYPHQLFLDCWLSFGYILGTVLIVFIVVSMRKVLTFRTGIEKDLMQMLFCMSVVVLMFSGTVFTYYWFYVFMGLVLSVKRRENVGVEFPNGQLPIVGLRIHK